MPLRDLLRLPLVCLLLVLSSWSLVAQSPKYEITQLHKESGLPSTNCFDVMMDSRGYVWITTDNGLARYDGKNMRVFQQNLQDSTSISVDNVNYLAEDNKGKIWIASNNGGLNCFDPLTENFESFLPVQRDSFNEWREVLTHIYVDGEEDLLIGRAHENRGFFRFSIPEKKFYPINAADPSVSFSAWEIDSDVDDPEILWTTCGGACRFSKISRNVQRFINPSEIMNHITDIYQTSESVIWVGGLQSGLEQLNPKTGEWKSFVDFENHPLIQFNVDYGLYYNGYASNYPKDHFDIEYEPLFVSDILTWSEKELLLACYSKDGLHFFDTEKETYQKVWKHPDFLVKTNEVPRGSELKKDAFGRIWVPSFEPGKEGGGVFLIDPLQPEKLEAPIVFTDLSVNDVVRKFDKNINYIEEVELTNEDNFVRIGFTFLNYSQPDSNQYEYRLEGHDWSWKSTDQQLNYATYTNLSPGEYIFKVRGKHPRGYFSVERSLRIRVIPDWYQTLGARLVFLLLGGMLLWGIYGLLKKRWQQQAQVELKLAEAARLKELDEVKNRFFTNITHEFRTPLTVILGMAEQLKLHPKINWEQRLSTIEKNGGQLLDLINQLLDLSKLQEGSLQPEYVQGDLVTYLRYLTESYQSFAFSQQKNLAFFSTEEEVLMDYDPQKMQRILGNLLSNAIKFTPEYGNIKVAIKKEDSQLVINVSDTGQGIPEKDLPYIFDRFYQVDSSTTRKGEGTGIGLALVRDMVELLGGTIRVESEIGKGSTFEVCLPISNNAILEMEHRKSIPFISPSTIVTDDPIPPVDRRGRDRLLVLLIEDNPDVTDYLQACLGSDHHYLTARNGRLGVELATEHVPDIVISDVMMPEMDGFEVCETLKTDPRTSHIPFIMLTAKATVEDRIAGLSRGADAYLAKPFHQEELQVRIEQLVAQRRAMQEHFSRNGELPSDKSDSSEVTFLQQLHTTIHEHLDEEDFDVPRLCRAMGMSRTQLHRKIKALTDQSTTEYVRNTRLQEARRLLETTDLSVSEVAYQTGFKHPNNFSTVYKKRFGYSPGGIHK